MKWHIQGHTVVNGRAWTRIQFQVIYPQAPPPFCSTRLPPTSPTSSPATRVLPHGLPPGTRLTPFCPGLHRGCSLPAPWLLQVFLRSFPSAPPVPGDIRRHLRLIDIPQTELFPLGISDIPVNSNSIIPDPQANMLASSLILLSHSVDNTSENQVSSHSQRRAPQIPRHPVASGLLLLLFPPPECSLGISTRLAFSLP